MNRKVRHYIDLVMVLTQKELKLRYKNSFFGYLWSVGQPLAFALVFFISFKIVMKVQVEDYTVFIISGLFPWQWFANSVNASPMVFLGNASIIKKVSFPRNLLPLSQVIQDMIHFTFAIPVIVIFLLVYHKTPSFSWLYGIPLLLCIQFLMTYGICLIVSSVNLFFRDLERLTELIVTLLFYFTPILYPETMVPEKYRTILHCNPLAPLMISWRDLFLKGTLHPFYLFTSFVYAGFTVALGYWVYRKLSMRFAEVL